MLAHQRMDLVHPIQVDIWPERVIAVALLQRQDHRLGHTRLAGSRRKTEVQTEVDRPRDLDHPAIDHQDIAAAIIDEAGDVARTSDVAHHRSGAQVFGLDEHVRATCPASSTIAAAMSW